MKVGGIIEALYGGAAGGGKSDALLMAALQYVDVPGYSAILLRKTYQDLALPGALMDRAIGWLAGTGASWKEKDKRWTFPSGASLTFGYLEHENDKFRYQSTEFQFIGFDELTQFSKSQYRYLFSRLRKNAGVDVPLRMFGASNPGGVGHEWVKQDFLIEGVKEGRVFIPAKLTDNPFLAQAEYRESLAKLDPITRSQLESGDWSARGEGGYFKAQWFKVQNHVPESIPYVRFWDLAGTEANASNDPDWTAGVLMGTYNGEYFVKNVRRTRRNPGGVEGFVKATAQVDGPQVPIYIEQEPGSAGKSLIHHYAREVLRGYAVLGQPSTGDKEERAKPFSAAAFNGLVTLKRDDWNNDYLDELEAFPGGSHDDQVDATSGAFNKVSGLSTYVPGMAHKQERQKAAL